jgi:MarR family transcriptional regulator, transcriptional regulator for hemolysin
MSNATLNDRFGPLLHGVARSWRQKLDQRLKPLGLSQAKWRTLLHLSRAETPPTQSQIAFRLGVEEPTLVNLLHRLERGGWIARRTSSHDRRCKTVHLGSRARQAIEQINDAAVNLREELLSEIPATELSRCMDVLERIKQKAEEVDLIYKSKRASKRLRLNASNANGHSNGAAKRKATA